MFMNLDALPHGRSMFTVYVTTDPEGTARSAMGADEVDVVADSGATWDIVVNDGVVHPAPNLQTAGPFIVEMYGPDARVVGVVNQSDGYVVYDAFAAGDETGANDL